MSPWEVPWLNKVLWVVCEKALGPIIGGAYGILAALYEAGPLPLPALVAGSFEGGLSPEQVAAILKAFARGGLVRVAEGKVTLTPTGLAVGEICARWHAGAREEDIPSNAELLRIFWEAAHEAGADGNACAQVQD